MCPNFKHNAFVCAKLKLHSITAYYKCAVKAGKLRFNVNDMHLTVGELCPVYMIPARRDGTVAEIPPVV